MAEEAEEHDDVVDDTALAPELGEELPPELEAEAPAFDPESVARLAGWAPKAEWRGPPAEWKDAATFLVDTVNVNKSLRSRLKEVEQTTGRMTRTAERIIEDNRRRAIQEAEQRLRYAVQNGDEEAAVEATRQVQEVSRHPGDPQVTDFLARNAHWFNVDAESTALANRVANRLQAQGADGAAQAKAAEEAVRKKFPELFDEELEPAPVARTPARPAPPVHGGQRTPAAPRGKNFNDLPPDAKKAAQDFARRGRCTLEEYARTYFEENA